MGQPSVLKIMQVVSKIVVDGARVVLCTPVWGKMDWMEVLDKITVQRVELPDVSLYVCTKDGEKKPAPRWRSMVSLTDGNKLSASDLNHEMVLQVLKINKWKGMDHLLHQGHDALPIVVAFDPLTISSVKNEDVPPSPQSSTRIKRSQESPKPKKGRRSSPKRKKLQRSK